MLFWRRVRGRISSGGSAAGEEAAVGAASGGAGEEPGETTAAPAFHRGPQMILADQVTALQAVTIQVTPAHDPRRIPSPAMHDPMLAWEQAPAARLRVLSSSATPHQDPQQQADPWHKVQLAPARNSNLQGPELSALHHPAALTAHD